MVKVTETSTAGANVNHAGANVNHDGKGGAMPPADQVAGHVLALTKCSWGAAAAPSGCGRDAVAASTFRATSSGKNWPTAKKFRLQYQENAAVKNGRGMSSTVSAAAFFKPNKPINVNCSMGREEAMPKGSNKHDHCNTSAAANTQVSSQRSWQLNRVQTPAFNPRGTHPTQTLT